MKQPRSQKQKDALFLLHLRSAELSLMYNLIEEWEHHKRLVKGTEYESKAD